MTNPLNPAWIEAGRQAGYPLTADMNGFQQEGFGRMDMTVGDGRRCSAANAYLRPAMRRSNLPCPHARAGHPGFVRGAARGWCQLHARRREQSLCGRGAKSLSVPGPSTRRNC